MHVSAFFSLDILEHISPIIFSTFQCLKVNLNRYLACYSGGTQVLRYPCMLKECINDLMSDDS